MTPEEKAQAMHQMNFEGNIIPHYWYKNITFNNGKPQLNAIIILGEIVYWYRPKEMKEETTGRLLGLQKRYAADLLQRSYKSFMDQFGLSKKQVKDAILCLEKIEVIKRVHRDISTKSGPVSNVLFIDLNVEALQQITYHHVHPSIHISTPPPTSMYTPPSVDVHTYTENTTENTTDTSPPPQKKQTNPLEHILSLAANGREEQPDTGPNPGDQWVVYGSEAVQFFVNTFARYPNQPERDMITQLASEQGFRPARWRKSLEEAALHSTQNRVTAARVVDVYRAGGTYNLWLATLEEDAGELGEIK